MGSGGILLFHQAVAGARNSIHRYAWRPGAGAHRLRGGGTVRCDDSGARITWAGDDVTEILQVRKSGVTTGRDTSYITISEDAKNASHRRRWSLCRTIRSLGRSAPRSYAQKVSFTAPGPTPEPKSRLHSPLRLLLWTGRRVFFLPWRGLARSPQPEAEMERLRKAAGSQCWMEHVFLCNKNFTTAQKGRNNWAQYYGHKDFGGSQQC